MDSAATIAIVGKPNVGKSTLFNTLIGKRHAIVFNQAGTTRDRIYQDFECNGYHTLLVDTGGLKISEQEDDLEADIQAQANIAISEADIILFLVDITQELTSDDFGASDILRKSHKKIILVTNKSDNANIEEKNYNFYELGFGDPIAISAIHKSGIERLNDEISETLKQLKFKKNKPITEKLSNTINICILGKPNAGKSSLINAITNSNKLIVSHTPGTTRDTINIRLNYLDQQYNLVDTAGIRKPGKIERGIEKFSILRCMLAIERADITVLLIDGALGPSHIDCHIAQHALEEEKGFIIAINKIDLLEKDYESQLISKLRRKFAFIPWAPIVFISAKEKKNIHQILTLAKEIITERKKHISTSELNTFFQRITQKHLPASAKLIKPKFMYASQVEISPPKFVLFFKNAPNLHFSYPRYLENEIRKEYGFNGTAINLKFKTKIDSKKSS